MQERCQTGIVEPQGGDEGIWVTVPEFMRIKRGTFHRSSIYRYIKKGIFKSKKTDNKCYVLVKDAYDTEKILYFRKLNKDKELMSKRKRHRVRFDFPLVDLNILHLLVPIITDPLSIGKKCSNISIAHKQVIEVDENIYNKLDDTAKEIGMSIPILTQHIIYQTIIEKIHQ
jgi:hypothetical protein